MERRRILWAILAGIIVTALAYGGVELDKLLTYRTPLFWQLAKFTPLILGTFVGVCAYRLNITEW